MGNNNAAKKKMCTRKKIIPGVICAIAAAAVIGIGVFYCTFFPNPLAKRVTPEQISPGVMSVGGNSGTLIAYFSVANNRAYTSDTVDAVASASLKIQGETAYGHAELYAMAARETTGGDIFPIKTANLYPESYSGAFSRHRTEMGTDVRPELTEHLKDWGKYTTVILIYPNWLSGLPQPVLSFLEEYDFSGKTIIPVATSQALGLGSGPEQIGELCPDAVVAEGLSVRDEDGLKKFLAENGYAE